MGLPTNSNIDTNGNYTLSNPYMGWYAQDNWRLSPKLTVTLGLRTEYELGTGYQPAPLAYYPG
jgi:outer membrane receptor for ferrienterochelin and colicin